MACSNSIAKKLDKTPIKCSYYSMVTTGRNIHRVAQHAVNFQCCDPNRHLPCWACARAFSVQEVL